MFCRTLRTTVAQTIHRPGVGARKNDRYDCRFTRKTIKHSPSVMVWGGFSSYVRGGLFFLPPKTTMRKEEYLMVLEEKLLPRWRAPITHFLQDGAPCHTAKVVKEWHQKHGVRLIDWPGNSPDLNPIENMWGFMKGKLSNTKLTSIPHLQEELKRLWCLGLSEEYCQKLADSMPRRLEMVINAGGGPTKY